MLSRNEDMPFAKPAVWRGWAAEVPRLRTMPVCLQYFERDGGTGLSIGQGVMMVLEPVAAALGYDVEGVGTTRPHSARLLQGAEKWIFGIVHLIATEHRAQATLVEGLVVSHERQSRNLRFNQFPDLGKDGGCGRVFHGEAVNAAAPVGVIFGFGLYQRVERVGNLSFSDDDQPHGAHTGALAVGGFEIYSGKI